MRWQDARKSATTAPLPTSPSQQTPPTPSICGIHAMTDDYDVKMSPLSQRFEQDGKVVNIEIYEDGEGGWPLEVVDEDNNSTMWEDSFDSDDEALAEALAAIEEH